MGIILTFLGCFCLYSKSVYFPKRLQKIVEIANKNPVGLKILGYSFFLGAAVFFSYQFGILSGLIIFLITLIFSFCLTIILLPLHHKYAYLFAGLSIIVVIIENII